MKRHLAHTGAFGALAVVLAVAVAGFLVSSCAPYGSTYYGFAVDISNAPPPRFAFDREPYVVLVPGTDVYEVDADLGYDVFRCDSNWYVNDNGYWYVSADYRGPFRIVSARAVPRRLIALPADRWRHRPRGDERADRRGDGRGEDHGGYRR